MTCPSTTSGLKSADVAIMTKPGKIKSVILLADGTNAATLILYDNASAASGTVLVKIAVDAGLVYESFNSDHGIVCNNGIYADVTGTGAEFIVHYELG
jgi:hypothetical protein